MENKKPISADEKDVAIHYIQTFSDTAREPILIIDSKLRVVLANASFYKNFQVTKEETENKLVYDLGNGQWNIPELKKLLEEILPEKEVFNDFEVSHEFPDIGLKVMLLNARRIIPTDYILLVIEDITARRWVGTKLADYAKALASSEAIKKEELISRIDELSEINKLMVGREIKMVELKKEIKELKEEKGI